MKKPKHFKSRLEFWRQTRLLPGLVLAPLALALLCSCRSVIYDMRQLRQPVVLNNNPILASTNASSLEIADVDSYTASVAVSEVVASSGNGYATTTTTSHAEANEAQVSAFKKIGGQPNRAIRNVSLNVDYLAVNGLLVLADFAKIEAAGDVAEIHCPAPIKAVASDTNAVSPAAGVAVSASTNAVPLVADAAVPSTNSVPAVSPVTPVVSQPEAAPAATNSPVTPTNGAALAPTPLPEGTKP
jgi:hypothetical protein